MKQIRHWAWWGVVGLLAALAVKMWPKPWMPGEGEGVWAFFWLDEEHGWNWYWAKVVTVLDWPFPIGPWVRVAHWHRGQKRECWLHLSRVRPINWGKGWAVPFVEPQCEREPQGLDKGRVPSEGSSRLIVVLLFLAVVFLASLLVAMVMAWR